MAEFKNPFHGIQLKYQRSHPLTKVVVIAVILVCTAVLIVVMVSGSHLRGRIEDMRNEAAGLEAENAELKDKLDNLDSVEGVEQIGEDELGLVDPDTIVIDPNP